MIDDETLLQQFFAEHRQHMADNGFTERVMAALPAREDEAVLTLRRWRLAINTFAILSISMMLIYWGIHSWEGMQTGSCAGQGIQTDEARPGRKRRLSRDGRGHAAFGRR